MFPEFAGIPDVRHDVFVGCCVYSYARGLAAYLKGSGVKEGWW